MTARSQTKARALGLGALVALALSGCGGWPGGFDPYLVLSKQEGPIEARCAVDVVGTGVVDVESDYLPRVVTCENGNADYEALKAQAVAARSYLYYRLATGDGSITDGQGDQVYTCAREPGPEHYQAVLDTAGEVLMYRGTPVASFYVAGAVPGDRASCVAAPADNDYSSTERFVTVNWEASADGVTQSSLGYVHPDNHANRGCQSQNGAHCLAEAGWSYEDILLFYYGADIEHVGATGECAAPSELPHGCGVVVAADAEGTVYDDGDLCFMKGCASGPAWRDEELGEGGGSLVTGGWGADEDDCFARWRLSFEQGGSYAVEVHIPDVGPRVSEVTYRVSHADVVDEIPVAMGSLTGWVELGVFDFDAGSFQYVELGDRAPESGDLVAGPYVVFDAVRVRPRAGAEDAGPVVDEEPAAAEDPLDLPPSVVECACVTASGGRAGAGAALFALGLICLRRSRSRRR